MYYGSRKLAERPLPTAFFQLSLSPNGKQALVLREDPTVAVPREQAVLELWEISNSSFKVLSKIAARDFELTWLSSNLVLIAEYESGRLVCYEQDLRSGKRRDVARVSSEYPSFAVSPLWPAGWILYDRSRPFDIHAWIRLEAEGQASWREVLVEGHQARLLGLWKDELVLLSRADAKTSEMTLVRDWRNSLSRATVPVEGRTIATLPAIDFGFQWQNWVYLVHSTQWRQELSVLDLRDGAVGKVALPPGIRVLRKPKLLGAETSVWVGEGPFCSPAFFSLNLRDRQWKTLWNDELTGLKSTDFQIDVEPERVVLKGSPDAPKEGPILLESYGGFRQVLPPTYDQARLEWLRRGGRVVLMQLESQPLGQEDVVNDLLHSAKEYDSDQVVYRGRSYGGTLGLMAVEREPRSFKAVWVEAALTDLIDYPHLEPGRLWLSEIGDPREPAQYRRLRHLSPLAKLGEASLPTIVASCARNDHVVDPRHSWSFVRRAEELGLPMVYLDERETGSHSSVGPSWTEELRTLDFVWRSVSESTR